MTNLKQDPKLTIHRGPAKIAGGTANGRKAWVLPGGVVTFSREEAERAAMVVKRTEESKG